MNELTVDELIAKLEEVKREHGNLYVHVRFSKTEKNASQVTIEADDWSEATLCIVS